MSIDTIVNIVIAIATIGTIAVALFTWREGASRDRKNQIEGLYLEHRENALLVDAWIGVGQDSKRHIIIQNNSSAVISDVTLQVKWGEGRNMSVPGSKTSWRLIPQGVWYVEREKDGDCLWKFPCRIAEDHPNITPQFVEQEETKCVIKSIRFTDASNNEWEHRYYSQGTDQRLAKSRLTLLFADDKRLAGFVGKDGIG